MYPRRDSSETENIELETLKDKPWLEWGRPQRGFLDLGCVGQDMCASAYTLSYSDLMSDRGMVCSYTYWSPRYVVDGIQPRPFRPIDCLVVGL